MLFFVFIVACGEHIGCCVFKPKLLLRDGEHAVCHLGHFDMISQLHCPEDDYKIFPVNDVEDVLVPVISFYFLYSHFIAFVGYSEGSTCADHDPFPTYY